MLNHTPPPSCLGVGGFERAAPSAADPEKQIAFEFKFTVKLKLEFDFDFDLISGSNFNKMGVEVVQISTYHFQI